jgi:hypothetical protein
MGMFDTVRSSYDLGPGYSNQELQTKDLECFMKDYWIDPVGRLFELDYSHTHDFKEVPEGERLTPWHVFEWVKNGNHGKLKPVYIFKVIEVYPARFDGHYAKWPRCHIYFRDGIVTEVRHNTDEVSGNL